MTELMKQYEAETGKKAERYIKIHVSVDGYDHWELVPDEEFVKWLADKLRWRPVSEKPKESDRYIVKYRQEKIVKKFIDDYDVVLGWNISLPDVEIIEWISIPPAPEGE